MFVRVRVSVSSCWISFLFSLAKCRLGDRGRQAEGGCVVGRGGCKQRMVNSKSRNGGRGIEIVLAHAFSSRCAPAGTARQTQAVLYYLQPYHVAPFAPYDPFHHPLHTRRILNLFMPRMPGKSRFLSFPSFEVVWSIGCELLLRCEHTR